MKRRKLMDTMGRVPQNIRDKVAGVAAAHLQLPPTQGPLAAGRDDATAKATSSALRVAPTAFPDIDSLYRRLYPRAESYSKLDLPFHSRRAIVRQSPPKRLATLAKVTAAALILAAVGILGFGVWLAVR